MKTSRPKNIATATHSAADKEKSEKFARAMAKNSFGRDFVSDSDLAEVQRSLSKRPPRFLRQTSKRKMRSR